MCVHIIVASLNTDFEDDLFKARLDGMASYETSRTRAVVQSLRCIGEIYGPDIDWTDHDQVECQTCGNCTATNGFQIVLNSQHFGPKYHSAYNIWREGDYYMNADEEEEEDEDENENQDEGESDKDSGFDEADTYNEFLYY